MNSNRLPSYLLLLFCLVVAVCCRVWAIEDGDFETRAQRIQAMTPNEKAELQRKQERYDRLDPDEKRRVRLLHEQLSSSADESELRDVMHQYVTWLRALPFGQRIDLLKLPPEQRVEEIRRLMQQQEKHQLRNLISRELSDEDQATLSRWLRELVLKHQDKILARAPGLRSRWAEIDDPNRQEILVLLTLRLGLQKGVLRPDESDLRQLRDALSPEARQQLEEAKSGGKLAELIEAWTRAAIVSKGFGPDIDRTKLHQFYREVVSEDPVQREYLEGLPRERFYAELTRLYRAHHFRELIGEELPGFNRGIGPRMRGMRTRPDEMPLGPPPGLRRRMDQRANDH